MMDFPIIRFRNPIPGVTLGQHLQNAVNHYPRAFKRELSMADLWIRDDILTELFAFNCFHASLKRFRLYHDLSDAPDSG